jgi:Ca2+-binding RTX toxin-like protein
MSNFGLVYIDFGISDYAFMNLATFREITSVQFFDGTTLDAEALLRLFEPGQVFANNSIWLGSGVASAEIGLQRWNDDLLLTYAGGVGNWIDTASLTSSNVMFEEHDGAEFGMPSGTRVLALTNWYLSNPATYVNQLGETGGGSFDLAAAAATAPIRLDGTSAPDALIGTAAADVLVGHEGADLVDGGGGDDDLAGNAGNDLLLGGVGSDTYRVGTGEGADAILDDDGQSDVLRLGAGITLANLTITETTMGLFLQIGAAENGDSVLIVDQSPLGGPTYPIEQVILGDGTVLTIEQIIAEVSGNHRPLLNGEIADQELSHGQPLSFTLPTGLFTDPDAGDTLTYEATLVGGAPLPSWLTFDPVTRTFSGTPTGDALEIHQIRVTATDQDGISVGGVFHLTYDGTLFEGTPGNDTFVGTNHDDRLFGQDGDDLLQGERGADLMEGGAGADTLNGGKGDDRLDGGTGDDVLNGGNGVDVFLLDANSGHDTIVDSSMTNRIQFASDSGVTLASLVVTRVGNDLRIGYGASSATVQNWYGPNGRVAEVVIVQDGLEYWYSALQLEGLVTGADTAPHAGPLLSSYLVANEGSAFSYQLPANLFTDTQSQASLAYDIEFLPAWLTFDPVTRTVSGTVPSSSSGVTFGLRVRASDGVSHPGQAEYLDIQIYTRPSLTVINGTAAAETLNDTSGHDYIVAGAGDDIIVAGNGNDLVEGGDGNDTIEVGTGDIVSGGAGADLIEGSGSALISGGTGNDRLIISGGAGSMAGEDGDDYLEGGQHLNGGSGDDTLVGNSSANVMFGNEDDDFLDGKGGVDQLWAGAGNDVLLGGSGADELLGQEGNDLYDGGTGNDVLRDFGGGDDRYIGFSSSSGSDTIIDGVGYDIAEFSATASLRLDQMTLSQSGSSDFVISYGTGAQLALAFPSPSSLAIDELVLYNAGIAFRYTAEQLIARESGTNLAPVRSSVAVGVQTAVVAAAFSYTVPLNFFVDTASQLDLVYTATGSDGSALPAWLSFDPGTRTLSGTPGAPDTGVIAIQISGQDEGGLTGSACVWVNVGNSVTSGSAANDTLNGTASGEQIAGLAGDDNINGLAGDDILEGGDGNDQLDGGAGADRMDGAAGNDVYIVDHVLDEVFEAVDGGIDQVQSSLSFLLGEQVENLLLTGALEIDGRGNGRDNTLLGNSAVNTLTGGEGNDWLDGGAGADVLNGGIGSDTYVVDDIGDTILDTSSQVDIDTVRSTLTLTLGDGLEALVLLGTANINGTGNTVSNIITGNSGNNTLNGGASNDTMTGGAGNDTYMVDNVDDVIVEAANEGLDVVQSSVSYTLSANVENLR